MPGFNLTPGGGAQIPLNLFVQPDEPVTKEGVWIQTPEKNSIKNIISKDSFVLGGSLRSPNTIPAESTFTFFHIYYGGKIYFLKADVNSYRITFSVLAFDLSTYTMSTLANTFQTADGTEYSPGCSTVMSAVINGVPTFYVLYRLSTSYYTAKILVDVENQSISQDDVSNIADFTIYNSRFIGRDGIYCYLASFTSSGSYVYTLDIYQYNTVTETLTLLKTFSISTSETHVYYNATVYNNKLYYNLTASTGTISGFNYGPYEYDIDSGSTASHFVYLSGAYIPSYTLGKQIRNLGYQNKLIYFTTPANTSTLSNMQLCLFDLDTDTFSLVPLQSAFEYTISELIGSSLFAGVISSTYSSDIYDFESETLSENTLAVLNGSLYKCTLVKTTLINYLRTLFADIWWYDTNFEEYPTYIGDGSAWNKIKN